MPPFEIDCPKCQARFVCPVERLAKAVRCGSCAQVFTAPSTPPAPRSSLQVAKVIVPAARPAARVAEAEVVRKPAPAHRTFDEDDSPVTRRKGKPEAAEPKTSPLVYALGGLGGLLVIVFLGFVGYIVKKGSDGTASATTPALSSPSNVTLQPLSDAALPGTSIPPPAPVRPTSAPEKPPASAVASNVTVAEAIQAVKRSTVYIRTHMAGSLGMGSGFFAGESGYVVTNAHVIGYGPDRLTSPKRIEVMVHSGEKEQRTYNARYIGANVNDDLALLWINEKDHGDALPPPLTFGRTTDLVEAQEVYIFGFPLGEKLGLNISVNKTTVSSLRKENGTVSVVQVAEGMTNGNSGGPVTNARGEVVGVSVAGIKNTPINFAIPSDIASNFVRKQIASGGSTEYGKLSGQVPGGRR